MGYCMKQNDSKFRIRASDKDLALRAIKTLVTEKGPFTWIDARNVQRIQRSRTLADAMKEWRWDIEEENVTDGYGDVISITFSGEKAGDDLQLFQAIAPFVVEGSYIEMHGEDGSLWRWVFTYEKTCVEKEAKVSW